MAFDATDPSTWAVQFTNPDGSARQLSQDEINYYAPRMQETADAQVYRANVMASMGLVPQYPGSDTYVSPNEAVTAAQHQAQLDNRAANIAASQASGLFSGVQGGGPQAGFGGGAPAAPAGGLALAQSNGMGLGGGAFGSGAAHTGFTAEQNANIKGAWNDLLYGNRNAQSIADDMTKYGVNFADISAATGMPADLLQAYFSKASGNNAASPAPAPSSGGQNAQLTQAPQYGNRPGGITQYPQMPVRPVLGALSGPAPLPGTGGGRPSYLPAAWRANFAEGGAVGYDSARVDALYNQLKADLNG